MQLGQRQPTGQTLREQLQVAADGGLFDDRMKARPPAGCQALWDTFRELAAMRPSGMGPSPIPGPEYECWQRLNGVRLTPWEVDTLKAMDGAALAAMVRAHQPQQQEWPE